MKTKQLVAAILSCMFILMVGIVNAQWVTTSGSTNAGPVGIGTTTPQNTFLVENGSAYSTPYTLPNVGALPTGDIGIYSISYNTAVDGGNVGVLSAIPVGDGRWNTAYVALVQGEGAGSDNSSALFMTNGDDAELNEGIALGVTGNGSVLNHGIGCWVQGDNTTNRGIEMIVQGASSNNLGIDVTIEGVSSENKGLRINVADGTTSNKGILVNVSTDAADNVGVSGTSEDATDSNIGVIGHATGTDINSYNWGTEGFAEGGILATGVAGFATGATSNIGIIGRSDNDDLDNIGAEGIASGENTTNKAVYGLIGGDNDGSDNYGVVGDLYNVEPGANLNYAIMGMAPGGNGSGTSSSLVNCTSCPVDFAGYFQGDVFCSNTYYYSDAKLKENVKEYKNALDQLSKLQIKSYTFKHKQFPRLMLPGGPQIGVLSANLKEVFPNMVKQAAHPAIDKEDTRVDFEAVNYNALIPVIIQATKELGATDRQLNDKVKEQEEQIAELNKQLAELKTLLTDICNNGCEGLHGSNPTSPVKDAELYQSIPNPTSSSAAISYLINIPFNSALISVTGISGNVLKEYKITQQGKDSVVFESDSQVDGTYKYSLIIDGKVHDSKSIVISRD